MGTNSDCSWQGKPQWWIDYINLLVILAFMISWYPNIIASLPLPTNGNEWQSLHHPLHCGLQLPLGADSHACQGRGFQRWHFLWNRHRSWLLSGDEKEDGLDGTFLISEKYLKLWIQINWEIRLVLFLLITTKRLFSWNVRTIQKYSTSVTPHHLLLPPPFSPQWLLETGRYHKPLEILKY